jgi:outer membrane lipoprotein-sorting protein
VHRRKLIALGTAVAAAGCLRRGAAAPESDDLLADAVETRTRGIEDLRAIRRTTIETAGERTDRVERVFQRPPVAVRREVLESDDPSTPPGSVVVRNRGTRWEYDPEAGRVLKRYRPNRILADRTRMVLEDMAAAEGLEYQGIETIDGRDAHAIEVVTDRDEGLRVSINLTVGDERYVLPIHELSEAERSAAELRRTVWIDDERRYPIGERNTVEIDGEPYHDVTVRFEDLAIDEGVDDARFRFEPPETATVVERGPEPTVVTARRERAREFVPYPLPEPSVPDGYELDRITVIERAGEVVTTLWYDDRTFPERELYVQIKETKRFREALLEAVDLENGRTVYRRDGRIESAFWTCEGISYEVSSPLFEAPVLDIAASITCPPDADPRD